MENSQDKELLKNIISESLGSDSSYAVFTDQFDSSLLNPLPRRLLREENDIDSSQFIGVDVWNCHEATFLLDNGVPIAGTLKIIINCTSIFIPESKSFKLYLNSFDMCKMGKTVQEAIGNYELQIFKDLCKLTESEVSVKFFDRTYSYHLLRENLTSKYGSYIDIEDCIDIEDLEIENYSREKSELLRESYQSDLDELEQNSDILYLRTNILRSRCRHTKQKDTGTLYIYLKFNKGETLSIRSIFKHIISFREFNEFHELCCENLFKDFMNTGIVQECCVQLLYTRRGSLDINPLRSNVDNQVFEDIISLHRPMIKQFSQ